MVEHLYIIVMHRRAPDQAFPKNDWASTRGILNSISTTDAVLAAAEKAVAQGSRVFIYETKCPKTTGTHVSQEVTIAEVRHADKTVTFSDHKLLFKKPPFRANQGVYFKWSEQEPTESMA